MKKKHLWFLLPLIFAMLFGWLAKNNIHISLSILALSCLGYTFFIALTKQD